MLCVIKHITWHAVHCCGQARLTKHCGGGGAVVPITWHQIGTQTTLTNYQLKTIRISPLTIFLENCVPLIVIQNQFFVILFSFGELCPTNCNTKLVSCDYFKLLVSPFRAGILKNIHKLYFMPLSKLVQCIQKGEVPYHHYRWMLVGWANKSY